MTGGRILKGMFIILGAVAMVSIYILANKNSQTNAGIHEQIPVVDSRSLEVEVLDCAGSSNAGQRLTDALRAQGYDVVEMKKNYSEIEERTFILDRSGNTEAARKLAALLGVPPDKVFQKIDRSRYLDLTVVIGKDYPHLKASQSSTERNNH